MRIDPYLKFDGTCREAFEFYRSCLGGDFDSAMTFRDGPPGMGVADESLDKMMHISLPIGSCVLMGCDDVPGFGPPTVFGDNFWVSLRVDSREEADSVFAKMSEGGQVTVPMEDMFWGSYFGALVDRFGINWQVHHSPDEA